MNCQERFLRALFSALETGGLPYLVWRNWGALPIELGRGDLDLVCGRADHPHLEATALEIAGRTGWRLYAREPKFTSVHFRFVREDAAPNLRTLRLDLHDGLKWLGLPWLTASEMLAEARVIDGLTVASERHAHLGTVVYQLLARRRVAERYREPARQTLVNEPDSSREFLTHVAGRRLAESLVRAISDSQWPSVSKLASRLRRAVVVRRTSHHPLASAASVGRAVPVLVSRLREPLGMNVYIKGPPGAVASIVERLPERLAGVFGGVVLEPTGGPVQRWRRAVRGSISVSTRGSALGQDALSIDLSFCPADADTLEWVLDQMCAHRERRLRS